MSERILQIDEVDADGRNRVCPVCEGTGEIDADDVTHPDHPANTGDDRDDLSCLACRDGDGVSWGMVTRDEYERIPPSERAAVRRARTVAEVASRGTLGANIITERGR